MDQEQSKNLIKRNLHSFSGPELRTWAKIYAFSKGKLHPFSCRITVRSGNRGGEWYADRITVYAFSNEDEALVQYMDAAKYNNLIDEKEIRGVFHEMINLSTYDELQSMYEMCTGAQFKPSLESSTEQS